VKQVIVVDEALRLPRGKLAAQVAHASVAAFLAAAPEVQRAWLRAGMPKVVVAAHDPDVLTDLHDRARAAGLAASLIRDAGRTVLEPGTLTCVGIGPAGTDDVDRLTGSLALVR
jgi:PTH2 family peptidyl-tRNA hydrolase